MNRYRFSRNRKLLEITILVFIFMAFLKCNGEILSIREFQIPVASLNQEDGSKYIDCEILDQRSVVHLLFILPLNRWDRSTVQSEPSYSQILYKETIRGKDLGYTLLGFLFSVIVTTDTFSACGIPNSQNTFVADLPKIKILKKPTALTTVSFANSSSVVSKSEIDRLKLISTQLLPSNVKLLLVGSADSTGDRVQNLSLAQDRAEAFKNIFIKQGLNDYRISVMTSLESDKGIFKDSITKGVVLFVLETVE